MHSLPDSEANPKHSPPSAFSPPPVMEAPPVDSQLVHQLKVSMHSPEGSTHVICLGRIPGPVLGQIEGQREQQQVVSQLHLVVKARLCN